MDESAHRTVRAFFSAVFSARHAARLRENSAIRANRARTRAV
jgi:hypothetical protein